MYADPTLMDLAAAYAKRRNGRKTKHAVACDRPGAKAKFAQPVAIDTWDAGHTVVTAQLMPDLLGPSKEMPNEWRGSITAKDRNGSLDHIASTNWYKSMDNAKRALMLEIAKVKASDMYKPRSKSSRPGAKAEMALGTYKEGDRTVAVDGRKYEVLPYQVDFFLADLGKQDDAAWRASVVKHYLRKGYIKATASRPGAKAEMGRAEQVMRDGSVHLDFRAAKEWLSSVTDDALRYIISDSQKAAKAMPDGNKWNYYHDLSLTAQDELQRRKSKSSRPGAKAKMAAMADVHKIVQPHWAVLSTGASRLEAGYDPRHPDNNLRYLAKRRIEDFVEACQVLPDEARKQIADTRVAVKNYLTNAKDKSAPQYQAAVKIDKALDAIYLPLRNLASRPGAKSTHAAAHPSWSEGVLGDKANPALVAYAWIDRNIGSLAGRTHMLLADLAATAHRNNPSASVQQAVLAAAKDMVRKGVAPADIKTFVENGGRFSRPGAKAKSTHAAPMSASVLLDYAMRAESRGDKAAAKNWTKQLAEAISAGERLGGGQMRDADNLRSKYGFAKSTHAAATPVAVTEAEYAAIAARDAVSKKILGDSQYQITEADRRVRAAGDAAYKAALARHNAWDAAWKAAATDQERAKIEAKAKAAEAGMRLYRASRPGAKAKSTHAALPPQTLEAERKPGGGSHSEAVSRKIATLINEGKPQDQAVAIALDLERRGEL